MAASTLEFTDRGHGVWESNYTSTGNTVIQLHREENGVVSVKAMLGGAGMQFTHVGTLKNPYSSDIIFQVNVPAGVNVQIESETKVLNASILTED